LALIGVDVDSMAHLAHGTLPSSTGHSIAPMPRRYFIRTFGCQMNEHDSQRLARQFEAEGMVAAGGADDADLIVFNTCCIRENADNKLYGNLGAVKAMKDGRPDLQ